MSWSKREGRYISGGDEVRITREEIDRISLRLLQIDQKTIKGKEIDMNSIFSLWRRGFVTGDKMLETLDQLIDTIETHIDLDESNDK